jgi:hypothetical protein
MEPNTALESQSENIFGNDTAPDRGKAPRRKRIPADICQNRHKGNDASEEAFARGKHTYEAMRKTIKDIYRQYPMGLTSKEVGRILGESNPNHYSPRISQLKAEGVLVARPGERRQGCEVLQMRVAYFNE